MASDYRPTLEIGDQVRLEPNAGWGQRINADRVREKTIGTVTSKVGTHYAIEWPTGPVSNLQRSALIFVQKPSERQRILDQIRLDRAMIEGRMIEATKRIEADQKIVEDAVPKLEELDGIISDLS